MFRLRISVVLLLVGLIGTQPGWGQAPDTSRGASIAAGLQAFPITGASARLNVDRLILQATVLPGAVFGEEGGRVGARVAYQVARRSTYSVFVGASVDLTIRRRIVSFRADPERGPEIEAERAVRADQLYAATIGAESFLGEKVALSGEAGVGYQRSGGQDDVLASTGDGFVPMLGLGLHYYFR